MFYTGYPPLSRPMIITLRVFIRGGLGEAVMSTHNVFIWKNNIPKLSENTSPKEVDSDPDHILWICKPIRTFAVAYVRKRHKIGLRWTCYLMFFYQCELNITLIKQSPQLLSCYRLPHNVFTCVGNRRGKSQSIIGKVKPIDYRLYNWISHNWRQ